MSMKTYVWGLLIVCILLFAGCAGNNMAVHINDDDVIDIADPYFSEWIQEIQFNREQFLGRTIRYEGFFLSMYWEGETIYSVLRFTQGCCGLHGFEVYLNEIAPLPDDTWVEVTGILEEFYVEVVSRYFMRLNVLSLTAVSH